MPEPITVEDIINDAGQDIMNVHMPEVDTLFLIALAGQAIKEQLDAQKIEARRRGKLSVVTKPPLLVGQAPRVEFEYDTNRAYPSSDVASPETLEGGSEEQIVGVPLEVLKRISLAISLLDVGIKAMANARQMAMAQMAEKRGDLVPGIGYVPNRIH